MCLCTIQAGDEEEEEEEGGGGVGFTSMTVPISMSTLKTITVFTLVIALSLGVDGVAGSAATKPSSSSSSPRNQRRAAAKFDTTKDAARQHADTNDRQREREQASAEEGVIELTADNFDRMTRNGTWFIDIYAPWCKHCKKLEPTWTQLAKKLGKKVKVGKLDGTKEVSIARRFGVRVYPSLFLLANGSTWQYQGDRLLDNLETFATSGYKKATPLEFWRAPNSSIGRFVGLLWRIPTITENTYWYLTEERGLSNPLLVGLLLLTLVAFAFIMVGLIDCFCVRRNKPHRD